MPTTKDRLEIWIELLEPIVSGEGRNLTQQELDRLQFDLMAIRKDLEQPATKYDRHIQVLLAQQPGDYRNLYKEICEKLSPQARERLFCVLQDLDSALHTAKRKARSPLVFRAALNVR